MGNFKPEVLDRLKLLEEKYAAMGQDLTSYLDGLLYADYLTYWDYIQTDTLLSLQKPKTSFPDEKIFIMYHQITELYFKLSLHELEQIANHENLTGKFFYDRVRRVISYFEALTLSFDIMSEGMEQEQFLKYRMALLPASGFQSAQYRLVEFSCTDLINLVDKEHRSTFNRSSSIEEMYEYVYWKNGATELATGKKTLTLRQFEEKYAAQFIKHANEYRNKNLKQLYNNLSEEEKSKHDIKDMLKKLDLQVNVLWPLAHYKTAARYLHRNPDDIAATGGTNWQKYLPPRFQKRIFFPDLWTEHEKEEWGKSWVYENIFSKKL